MKKNIKSEALTALRRQAEELLKKGYSPSGSQISDSNTLKLVHELEVYQIELEMQNEELIKMNDEKDKFFFIMAHDLRGPMGSLNEITKILAEEVSEMKQEKIQEIANCLKESAANVFCLIGNLLEWSRMQHGLIEHKAEILPLLDVIKKSINSLSNLASLKEQEIQLRVNENLFVKADTGMLESTLRNLISNAIKFSYRGEKILISAKVIKDNFVETAITDSGIGINESLMSKLFHIDEKTGRNGTEGEESTGLGLLLCKELVEKNGGKLWAESNLGKGSIFRFTTPLSQYPAKYKNEF